MSQRASRHAGIARAALVALAAACASQGAPPGGPPDRTPPIILKVTPDSGTVGAKAKTITVQFNKVISERPRGGDDLSAVMVLSPSDGAARIDWHRDYVSIRPRKAFHPNTAYSLSILAGVTDLRGNVAKTGRTYVFSTGGTIPRNRVVGAVFDWTTLRPVGGALIDARLGADTTFKWIARTDSVGRYALPFLPNGSYTVRALVDANKNGKLDPRELWDSITVAVSDSTPLDLYAFAHDTLGARVVGADVKDSVTIRLTFDRPLALTPALAPEQIEIRRADSSRVAVRFIGRAAQFDSLTRARDAAAKDSAMRADTTVAGRKARERADSVKVLAQRDSIERARVEARRAARDTMPKVIAPVPTRQAITFEFVAVLSEKLVPGAYRVTARQVVSVSQVVRTSERSFSMAKPVEKKKEDPNAPKGATPPSAAPKGAAPKGAVPVSPAPASPTPSKPPLAPTATPPAPVAKPVVPPDGR